MIPVLNSEVAGQRLPIREIALDFATFSRAVGATGHTLWFIPAHRFALSLGSRRFSVGQSEDIGSGALILRKSLVQDISRPRS